VAAVDPAFLRLSIDAPAEVRVGEPVPITLRLENVGDRPLDLYLRGRTIAFDVVVTRDDGSVVWQRLEGEIIPAIIQQVPIGAGETFELRTEWGQRTTAGLPVEPGRYFVQAMLPTDEQDPLTSQLIRLRIVTD
jgi:hypothetical protein